MAVDAVVMGSNPLMNALLLNACLKRGQSVLLFSNRVPDLWPYQLCADPHIQFLIANAAGVPKLAEAEVHNTSFAYQPPARRWSDLFSEQLINRLRLVEPHQLGMVPHGFDAVMQAMTMMGENTEQTILHLKPISADKTAEDEQKQKLRAEINLPEYPKAESAWQNWHEDFTRYAKPVIRPIKLSPAHKASQMVIPKRLLLTSQDNRFSRVATPDPDKPSLTRFRYELPGIEAFGTAAWASHDPQIVIEQATEDILRATRYGLPSSDGDRSPAAAC